MRILKAATGAAVALALALTLSGCLEPDPVVTPAPQPSVAPIFESDEEALAAAEEAYALYLEVADLIAQEGGVDPERLREHATSAHYQEELEGFDTYASRGWHTVGDTQFTTLDLQRYTELGDGYAEVAVYLCLDFSDVRIIDADGSDVTPTTRPETQTVEAVFESAGAEPTKLLLGNVSAWTDSPNC